jgi:hypothetical protein
LDFDVPVHTVDVEVTFEGQPLERGEAVDLVFVSADGAINANSKVIGTLAGSGRLQLPSGAYKVFLQEALWSSLEVAPRLPHNKRVLLKRVEIRGDSSVRVDLQSVKLRVNLNERQVAGHQPLHAHRALHEGDFLLHSTYSSIQLGRPFGTPKDDVAWVGANLLPGSYKLVFGNGGSSVISLETGVVKVELSEDLASVERDMDLPFHRIEANITVGGQKPTWYPSLTLRNNESLASFPLNRNRDGAFVTFAQAGNYNVSTFPLDDYFSNITVREMLVIDRDLLVDLDLPATVLIKGRVLVDGKALPIDRYEFSLKKPSTGFPIGPEIEPDQSGHFQIALVPGPYRLFVKRISSLGHDIPAASPDPFANHETRLAPVQIDGSGPVEFNVITAPVRVRITENGGTPRPVYREPRPNEPEPPGGQPVVGPGVYLEYPDGVVFGTGLVEGAVSLGNYEVMYYPHKVTMSLGMIEVKPSGTDVTLDARLIPVAGRLAFGGRAAEPRKDAILLEASRKTFAMLDIQSDGAFSGNVPPGKYFVSSSGEMSVAHGCYVVGP